MSEINVYLKLSVADFGLLTDCVYFMESHIPNNYKISGESIDSMSEYFVNKIRILRENIEQQAIDSTYGTDKDKLKKELDKAQYTRTDLLKVVLESESLVWKKLVREAVKNK